MFRLKTLFFYLKLAWLCLKLLLHLSAFALTFLLAKINREKTLSYCLVIAICLSWVAAFILIKARTTPEINLKKVAEVKSAQTNSFRTQTVTFREEELKKELEYYQSLEQRKIENLALFLNLQQLNAAALNNELAAEYLNKAAQIEPQINNLNLQAEL